MRTDIFRVSQLVVLLTCAFGCSAWAQTAPAADGTADLPTVEVVGEKEAKPATKEVITRQTLDREMVRSSRDLVRYSADVGVSEASTRSKGFAIRGVEENRVNMSIDGIALPNLQINSLYNRYGNFNSSRLNIDPALVREVNISKGGDAVRAGGGAALGGSVDYKTLEAGDLVQPGKQAGGFVQSGYHSRNREWTHTAGMAYKNATTDLIVAGVREHGHETKSLGGNIKPWVKNGSETVEDSAYRGQTRIYTEPMRTDSYSWLAKASWLLGSQHLVGVSVTGQKATDRKDERTHNLFTNKHRDVVDRSRRDNIGLFYEYFPAGGFISSARIAWDRQVVKNGNNIIAIYYPGGSFGRPSGGPSDSYSRYFHTDYRRWSVQIESRPVQLGGEHVFKLGAYTSRARVKNENQDGGFFGGKYTPYKPYTIQHPMVTRHSSLSLQDAWKINDVLSIGWGVGFDRYKVRAEDFDPNFPCRACKKETYPDSSFSGRNGYVDLGLKVHPNWRLGYSISSGYRAPTASEMYFTFDSAAGRWLANPKLKPERSVSHSLSMQGDGRLGKLQASVYRSRYRDFMYENEKLDFRGIPEQQMINLDSAHMHGVEVSGRLHLEQVTSLPAGWSLMGTLGYGKGKLSNNKGSLLAVQPARFVMGLDYESPSGQWGIMSRVSYSARKKPEDAHLPKEVTVCRQPVPDGPTCPHRWLNKSYTVVDVFGYYTPSRNLTLRAGVYNLLNRKYHTWDALRGINKEAAVTNSVDNEGQGLQRYYAPGRNFAVSLEYRF